MSTPSTPSMSSIIAPEAALVQENFAPIFAASFVGMIFFGIVINQTYYYYTRYSRDVIWVKIFVAWVVLLDVLSTIFTIWWMYFLFISNWGNIEVFNVGNWLISTDPVLLGLMACSTHVFFARRIYLMTKNIYLAALIVCLGLMTMGGALSVSIKFLQIPNFASLNKLKAAVILWLLPSTLGDIVITVSISWHLRYKKSGFKRTDRIVDKLIRGTVQNGLLTALTALTDLILFLSTPKPFHIAVSFVLPRLYSNTILSSLNSRNVAHPDESTTEHSAIIHTNRSRRGPPEVMVHVEAHEMVDSVKSNADWESCGKDGGPVV